MASRVGFGPWSVVWRFLLYSIGVMNGSYILFCFIYTQLICSFANLPYPPARVTFSTSEVYMPKVRNSIRHEIFKASGEQANVSYSVINHYSFPNLSVETHTVMSWFFLCKYRRLPRNIRSYANSCYAFQILLTTSAVAAEHVMCRMQENG